MSDRTDKQLSRPANPAETPEPTRPDLMAFIEDKFDGKEGPRYLEMRIAVGPKAQAYSDMVVHQKEFKINAKKPERAEMVALANDFVRIAQTHADELEKPCIFAILAVNNVKGAHPYGVFIIRMRPNPFLSKKDGPQYDEDGEGISSDASHRDSLMKFMLEHARENDEHNRFMYDGALKSWGGVINTYQGIIGTQQEMLKDLRDENRAHMATQLEYRKAIEEAYSQKQERDIKAANAEMKQKLLGHGVDFLMQMVPVVTKAIENRHHDKKQLAAGEPEKITASSESMAIDRFVNALSTEQKATLFGSLDEKTGTISGGILTTDQVRVVGCIGGLSLPPSAITKLVKGGQFEITDEQLEKIKEVVSMDTLLPLLAVMMSHIEQPQEQSASAQ